MYKNILAMTDFSEDADYALDIALSLVRSFGAKLTILHVAHDESQLPVYLSSLQYEEVDEMIKKEVKKNFDRLVAKVPSLKGIEYKTLLRRGSPYVQGIIAIEEGEYDLVVIGSHGESGIKKFFYGSTSEKIIRRSPTSVFVTKR